MFNGNQRIDQVEVEWFIERKTTFHKSPDKSVNQSEEELSTKENENSGLK